MSEHDHQAKAELSSEELDTLERMLLESARNAGLPERRAEKTEGGGNGSSAEQLPRPMERAEGGSPKITLAAHTLDAPSALDDDAEPLSLRDLERVYEPGEPPPSLADARPKSVPPPLPPTRRSSAPPPAREALDHDDAGETSRGSAPPPHRPSAPPPPPPHRPSASPPRLALDAEALEAETGGAAPTQPTSEADIDPGPDSARRDLQLLASVRPPAKAPDAEFDELMRIHVAPLAENLPAAPGLPKDVLGPAAAAALTGGSMRPRPRAPLKSRPATDDDPKAVSSEAAAIADAASIDSDLIPPSFRDLEPPSSRASSGGEAAPKKKKKKKKAAPAALESSIAPTASTLEPKRAPEPGGAKPAGESASRVPLYAVAAALLLGGGYFIGKLGNDAAPAATSSDRPTTTAREAQVELAATPAPRPTTAPTAAAEVASPDSAALASSGQAANGAEPAPLSGTLPVAAATTTAATVPSSSLTGGAASAPVAPPADATAAAAASTATPPQEAPTATPVAPPPAEAAFDKAAASAALSAAAGQASGCKQEGDPSGTARVQVTFVPSGRVTSANVQGPPFAGTPTGGCIARAFRSASVPPFSGDPVTVSKTVSIP